MPAPLTPSGSLPPINNNAFVDERGFLTTLGLNTLQQLSKAAAGLTPLTVAKLPDAASAGEGAVFLVKDASTTLALGIGTTVVGGGTNKVPVFSDSTNWIIG